MHNRNRDRRPPHAPEIHRRHNARLASRPALLHPARVRNNLSIFELTRVNYAAGALYAEITNALLAKTGLKAEDIDVVAYDGQTIYQEPPDRDKMADFHNQNQNKDESQSLVDRWTKASYACGLFIAESGVVAALTNITTVTQFRPVDHALGGSGAPLMQYLDFVAFRRQPGGGGPTVTLNIGGIANLQLAHRDRDRMLAFDTGPGNVMIDHVMRVRCNAQYDKDGEVAARGTVLRDLLEQLQEESRAFFGRSPPRSAWRLDFGSEYADRILQANESALTEDLVATVTMFTAVSVERALVDFVLPRAEELGGLEPSRVIVSGGGTRNCTLVRFLRERLAAHGVDVCLSDEVGLPAAYKEAIKFATLGFAAKRGIANNIPKASGAERFAVLGKMTLAPGVARI
ncbi:uncharacterized protein APUU_40640S [Aspergillus puulaauensis]|uniref:Anhydro-N-acetylmuramic acid kinase n=1 Tax=Aspergillus puulaauensis TaxID=1220207 RepID=A0A7R7XME0_9EURO|nr:uncharacterized protein APUU_40640S [Aspergillus puulaauensis]BCS24196.1 hypothetical protein APUU_40640S [Aspergillus puulaauensis]